MSSYASTASTDDHIKSSMLDFVVNLSSIYPSQLSKLSGIVYGNSISWNWQQLNELLSTGSFVEMVNNIPQKLIPGSIEEQFYTFHCIYLLRDLLGKIALNDLMTLLTIIQTDNIPQRASRIEGIHGVLTQLGPAAISDIHEALSQQHADDPLALIDRLREFLTLDDQHYHLYQTLTSLFLQNKQTLLNIASMLSYINDLQLYIISRLSPLRQDELEELYLIFQSPSQETHGLTVDPGHHAMDSDEQESGSPFYLTITEQPPERCVYKRNVKPGPVVTVSGGSPQDYQQNMKVACILVRCDTEEDVPNFLIGANPQDLTESRVCEWKRLKVTATSHQQNETLFCFRFELRRFPYGMSGDDPRCPFEVLAQVTTNPVHVLSHSTQLKTPVDTLPTVFQVIPASGSPHGFTRVAILGADFVESPTTRVKFGNIEVHPSFHGPKTLVCRTPAHVPGKVEVRVCNDVNGWSKSYGEFYFDNHLKEQVQSPGVAFETGFETARVLQ